MQDEKTLKPLSGVACYAFIYRALNDTIPNGYHSSIKNHPVKHLKRPIPGVYSKNWENPSTPDPIIEEVHYTNQEGRISFNDLRFSEYGPIGKYYPKTPAHDYSGELYPK